MALTLPVVNGSSGTWGTILNAALNDIDTRLTAATDANTTQDSTLTSLDGRIDALEAGGGSSGGLTVVNGTLPAATVGEVVLDTNTGFLYYGASVGGTPTLVPFPGSYLAKLKRTTAQTYGNNSAGALQFTAADFDRLSGWSAGTNPSRYTAKVPGAYEFTGLIGWASSSTGIRAVSWYKNGVEQNTTATLQQAVSGNGTYVVARPAILALNVNDYVEMVGLQSSGGSLATDTTTAYQPGMQVKYLGYNV